MQKPCPNCPFSRKVEPGALGGSAPEVYIGQSVGPFIIPCHQHYAEDDPDGRKGMFKTPQCIGAAIFRANTNIAPLLPEQVMKQEKDTEAVFGSFVEFLAHHAKISQIEANQRLVVKGPFEHFREQLLRPTSVIKVVRRG